MLREITDIADFLRAHKDNVQPEVFERCMQTQCTAIQLKMTRTKTPFEDALKVSI